jgi:probable F420-dependent oxidoreductase
MKAHAILDADLGAIGPTAAQAEQVGFDGVWTTETSHDPFLPLVLAASSTKRLEVGTAIAVALPRNPVHLAQLGWDLHTYSQGRFILGLGSQVRAHVERRFGAAYNRPAARMRELVLAITAIWRAWETGEPLDFRGEFYTHTLMTPLFNPGPNPFGRPRIYLAGVGPRMVGVAGEVADGLLVHGLTSKAYLDTVALPALKAGSARAGRSADAVEICRQLFLVTGLDERERAAAEHTVRERLAFYASTSAYRVVLDCHGWSELQGRLAPMARRQAWAEMSRLIDDEMLDTFAVVGEPEQLPNLIRDRFGSAVQRVSFNVPFHRDPGRWAAVVAALRAP